MSESIARSVVQDMTINIDRRELYTTPSCEEDDPALIAAKDRKLFTTVPGPACYTVVVAVPRTGSLFE